MNALLTLILAFISVLLGGIISDNWRKHDPLTKTYVQLASSIGAAPFISMCYSLQISFWLSISMLGINYLLAEAWSSPTFTMLLDSIPPQHQGFAVNIYLLFASLAAMISTSTLDLINHEIDAPNHPHLFGHTLMAVCLISYLGSAVAFAFAGRDYKKYFDGQ